MIGPVLLVAGALVGFAASRLLRRPQRAATAASVARNVSGSLGRRRGLTPPELQRACFSEMVRHVQVSRHGRTHAPARYAIRLHPDDLELVEEARRWFTGGLEQALRDAAAEHGWRIDGTIAITYEADPGRRPGVPAALAAPPDGPRNAEPTEAPAARPAPRPTETSGPKALALVRSDTGQRVVLRGEVVTLGRSSDRDLTIDDNRISRAHLRFERRSRGWVVIDEGSANGSLLGDRHLDPDRPAPIRPGDVISVGPVSLQVAAGPATRTADAGTRALDDSDRNRISREFLPPPGNSR